MRTWRLWRNIRSLLQLPNNKFSWGRETNKKESFRVERTFSSLLGWLRMGGRRSELTKSESEEEKQNKCAESFSLSYLLFFLEYPAEHFHWKSWDITFAWNSHPFSISLLFFLCAPIHISLFIISPSSSAHSGERCGWAQTRFLCRISTVKQAERRETFISTRLIFLVREVCRVNIAVTGSLSPHS